MSYDLTADNGEEFHMGAFSFPVILEITSYLWPAAFRGGQFFFIAEADERFRGHDYPPPLANSGFHVTMEEAKIMARFARNWCVIQRELPEENRTGDMRGQASFQQEDVKALMIRAMASAEPGPWPVKYRDDFVEKLDAFADFAERSGGFVIW